MTAAADRDSRRARRLRARMSADIAVACAVGVVAALDGIGVVRAEQVLAELARRTDEPVATVAAHMVALADPVPVPDPDDELTALLRRRWPRLHAG